MSHNGCVSRRSFLQSASALSLALLAPGAICAGMTRGRRIGIIGLDSSHGVEFTRILQGGGSRTGFDGYSVTHAYPYGSRHAVGPREASAAQSSGFVAAVTTQPGVLSRAAAEKPTLLPRVSLNGHYQKKRYVRALISGLPFRLM